MFWLGLILGLVSGFIGTGVVGFYMLKTTNLGPRF